MSDDTEQTRFIPVTRKQAELLERIGELMLKEGDHRAPWILSMVLAWRAAPNVRQVPVEEHSVRVAERMVGELDSERARLRVLDGGAA